MIADTIIELPVTLADIKREALKVDFLYTTKNKIYNKDPNVPEVFSLCDDVLLYNGRVVIPRQARFKKTVGLPKNVTPVAKKCYSKFTRIT